MIVIMMFILCHMRGQQSLKVSSWDSFFSVNSTFFHFTGLDRGRISNIFLLQPDYSVSNCAGQLQ